MASGDITGRVNIPTKKVEYVGSDTDSTTTIVDPENNSIEVNVKENWVRDVAEEGLKTKYIPVLNVGGTSLLNSLPNCFYWANYKVLVKYWIGVFPAGTCVIQDEKGYYRKSINIRTSTLDDVYNSDNYNKYAEEEYVNENFFNKHEDVTLEYDDESEQSKSIIFEAGLKAETSLGYFGNNDTVGLYSFSNIRIDNTDNLNGDITINSGKDINLDGRKVNYNGNEVATQEYVDNKENLIEITWSDLKELRNNGQLIPGRFYRITDYACTTATTNTSSAGHAFDIIVVADSEFELNESARAIQHSTSVSDYFADNNLSAWELKYCLDNDTDRFAWADSISGSGKGVIYWLKDEFNNECPYDFKNIIYKFVKSFKVHIYYGASYYGYYEPTDEMTTINGTTYYKSSRISYIPGPFTPPTEIWTTTTTFSSDMAIYSISGETVIPLSYTIFDATSDSYSTYTFNYISSSVNYDASMVGISEKCYNNVIKEYYNSNRLQLNWNIFRSISTTLICHSNILGNQCYSNTFGNQCYSNTFGSGCYSNVFGDSCHSNIFGTSCYGNTFGNGCSNNTFGYDCHSNIFGTGCSCTKFGNICQYNIFGDSCKYNTFGSGCQHNTFGNYCSSSTLGDDCMYITFGTSSSTINYCQYNIFDNGCKYIYLSSIDTDASSSNYLQNIHIHLGVSGSSSANRLEINIPDRKLSYQTDIVRDAQGYYIMKWHNTLLTETGKYKASVSDASWTDITPIESYE